MNGRLSCVSIFFVSRRMSGVSLLASRLKCQQPPDPIWVSQENVKLSDSVQSSAQAFDVRSQIESLITQTNAQERALLRYHAELTRRVEESDHLKERILAKNLLKYKYRAFLAWKGLKTNPASIKSPRVHESVNLNDTLRNLALSLTSPLQNRNSREMDISTSTIKSVAAVPFQTARIRSSNFPSQTKKV